MLLCALSTFEASYQALNVAQHLIGDMISWRKHLAGLKEIVDLRGGVETVDSNKPLRTMLSW